jgi:hypothetical protein
MLMRMLLLSSSPAIPVLRKTLVYVRMYLVRYRVKTTVPYVCRSARSAASHSEHPDMMFIYLSKFLKITRSMEDPSYHFLTVRDPDDPNHFRMAQYSKYCVLRYVARYVYI